MIEDAPGAVMIISLETRNAVDGVLTVLLSFFFHCHFISEFDHHLLSDDFSRWPKSRQHSDYLTRAGTCFFCRSVLDVRQRRIRISLQ